MAIGVKDAQTLYNMGRRYTSERVLNCVIDAAMFFVASDDSEKNSVRMGFMEGVRNYAPSQWKVDEYMKDFDDWVEFWETKESDDLITRT